MLFHRAAYRLETKGFTIPQKAKHQTDHKRQRTNVRAPIFIGNYSLKTLFENLNRMTFINGITSFLFYVLQ